MFFSLNEFRFIIYENTKKNIKNKLWEYKDILIKFIFKSFDLEGKIFHNSLKLSMSLVDAIITHEKSKNPNYQKFIFGDLDNRGKMLYIEFEKNPNFEKSDYRFIMRSDKRIHILYDMHIFNYINEKVMNILNTKINFEEIKDYAHQDSINKYIQSGYVDSFLENFQHFNIDLYIDLTSPIILLPLDPFVPDNNKCIFLHLGKLEIRSDLPKRQEKDKDYKVIKNEELMYDIYKIKLLGTKLSTLNDCTPVNNSKDYEEFETKIIRDFDLFIDCKKLIEIKNPYFDDLVCELNVSKVEMKIDEFQILFIIDYLGNFFKNNKSIFEENEIDKFLGIGQEEKDEEEIIKEFQNRYSIKLRKEKIYKKDMTKDNLNKSDKKSEEDSANLSCNKTKENLDVNDNNIDGKDYKKDDNEGEDINTKTVKEEKNKENSDEMNKSEINEDKKSEDVKSEDQNKEENNNEKEKNKIKESFVRINEIKNIKRTMRIKFIMNEMSISFRKIHPDLKRENFLVLIQKAFEFEYLMMDNNDMLTLIRMKNIYLYDKDIDDKKYNIISEQFQCLINSSQNINNNTISFIDMTSLYRKINGASEIDTIFDMNDLNIIISFDSILRIYQFMMYYYDKYNEKVYEIEHPQENIENLNLLDKNSLSSKNVNARNSKKNLTVFSGKYSRASDRKLKLLRADRNRRIKKRKSSNCIFKTEKVDSKITIVYKMKNTIFKIPLNPKDPNTPIFSFSFNLIYNQKIRNLYTNILQLPQNFIIEKTHEIQDSTMNLLISKVYLDIEFKNYEPSKFIYENEKLVSNFRMSYYLSSFLYIPQEQSMTIIDIDLEPLFCKFGVKQMGKILDFYNKFNSFWFDFNNIKYIPYLKPEYVINGKVVINPNKKRTFRECVLRIMIATHIRRALNVQLKLIRSKYKKKIKIKVDNIYDFNSHYEMNIKFGKIIMIFYDNISDERRLLLNLNFCQFFMKSISNTIIKDKNNVSNTIYEMITGEDLPIQKYNVDTLANYMNINFRLEINYFNLILNEFEPLMEKIKFDYLSMQTCSFSRKKNYININDIINFNISSNAIKVVNLFLLRYYQNESDKKFKKKLVKVSSIKKKNKEATIKFNSKNIEPNKEISLLLINYTELNIDIIFDANFSKKYKLKAGETLTFYKTDLFLDRNNSNYSSRLNAIIIGKAIIKSINFGRNNTRQYKLKVKLKNKEYDLYISVKVNTSGLIKQVHFCPSFSIYNDTNYKDIEIFIKNPKIKKNSLIIPQNDKCFIPLAWALCDPPLSNIYMKINNNIDPIKLYEYINDIIVEPLNEEANINKKEKKKKIEKDAKNNKNKYWNQNIIKSLISECDNRKDNKIISFNDDNKMIYFCIDYYFVQSKEIKKILEEKEKDLKINNPEESMTTMDEEFNDYSYDYLLFIRPYATFVNQLPFNLIYTHGNSNEKIIKTLNKSSLYNCLSNDNEQIRITFYYNGEKYRSPYFNITNNEDYIELQNYDNPKSQNLSCCILKSTKIVELKKNFNYDVKLIEFSTSSYEYTFYFKYLIMNKMPNSLWAKTFHKIKKNKKVIETELKSGQLTVINYVIPSNKFALKEENSNWSKTYDLNIIKENGTIEIDTEIEKDERKIINTKDILCILSWGKNYENSRILILQEQFIIHNKLNFDVYYKQEKDKEKINHFLKKDTFESINRTKEKKIFRIGLFDINCGEFNYSSPFEIGIIKAVDLLIKINENDKNKYDKNSIYTNDNNNYYILIRIESHVFDDGLIYLSLIYPYFPALKIENETKTDIKIMETKNDSKPLIITNSLLKGFPFVWKNNSEEKSNLFFEIYGIQKNFSFAKYGKESFEIEIEEEYQSKESKSKETKSNISNESSYRKFCKSITFTVYAKNKSLTRCLKVEETENTKQIVEPKKIGANLFTRNGNKVISSSFHIEMKGIGFSIINEALKELFYISFYDINIKYLSNLLISEKNILTDNTENIELHLNNFQIDYCLNDSIKYIIAPKKQIIPSNDGNANINMNEIILLEDKIKSSERIKNTKKITPFISFLVTRQSTKYLKTMEESTIYRQIDLIIQEFICKIEQYTLTNLLNIINEFMELLDYSKKIEEESTKEDIKLLNEKTSVRINNTIKKNNGSKVLINYLFLSSMKIHLTIRLNLSELYSTGFIKLITRVLGSIGNSLTRFTDIPLIFTEKGFENIYISLYDMLWIIFEEYKRRGTKQILTILGSSDLIGNPVKLLEGIGTGFYELVNEPRKGFVQGPLQFGKGIAKGLGKLLSGIIGGTFGVVESITGTLYSATQSIMGKNHKNFLDEEDGPGNIASGAVYGLYGGFKEIYSGVKGVVMQPIKETKKHGVKGFFKGLGKGFVGLIFSPIAAILRFVHSLATGTKNTLNLIFGISKIKTKRFRHPRVLLEGIEPLRNYEFEKAEAKEAIFKIFKIETNHIYYAHYFCCANKGLEMGISLFIKTDKFIAILYEAKKLIFFEKLRNIKNCEIHFMDGEYIIKFNRKKGGGKGFKVMKEYFNMVCIIYDLFSNNKNKEIEKNILFNKEINNNIENDDNNTILEINNNEEISEEINIGNKKEEIIQINNIYNINNINNIYNINTINDINDINNNLNKNYNTENGNIFINNINFKKSLNQDTVINDNSIFYYDSIENLSDDNENKKKLSFKNKRKNKNENSINESLNGYNSRGDFINKKILNFSDSSSK